MVSTTLMQLIKLCPQLEHISGIEATFWQNFDTHKALWHVLATYNGTDPEM